MYERALSIFDQSVGKDSAEVGSVLDDFSSMYLDERKFADAEPLFARLVTVEEKVFGTDAPILAQTLPKFAQVERKLGHADHANQLETRAKTIAGAQAPAPKAIVTKKKPATTAAAKRN
jgi:hypothetical protein